VSRSGYALLAGAYALIIAYAGTIIGPVGLHFVAIDPSIALSKLLQMPYVQNGSDQRSDWMGNLVTLVPLGFLVAGWMSPARRGSVAAAAGAFVVCVAFILMVKYAQLFFPPRTVTLNYVMAQSLGAMIGIAVFGIVKEPLAGIGHARNGLESLRVILRIYAGLVLLFLLMPLDFALNLEDAVRQLDKASDSFTTISGEGRPIVVRVAVTIGSILAMAPVGALLTIAGRGRVIVGRSVGAAAWIGFCAMTCVYLLTIMVMSGTPSLPAIGFRTLGIVAGAWTMHWLTRQDPEQIRWTLRRLVPWIVPLYLLALFAVNGLLSVNWITPETAATDFYDLGLYPLFNYYIVTKAQAAKNVAAHVVMYAPIGVMIWLWADQRGRTAAFILAAALSTTVEAGRFLRPGLVPDINAIPLAGVAAWSALVVMPMVWRMLSGIAVGTIGLPIPLAGGTAAATAIDWREREIDRRTRRRDPNKIIGDIEDY